MNTKNEQVSSGLKVLCYMSEQFEFALFSEPPNDPMYDDMFPVVRLSDAEQIISDLQNLVTAENQRKQQLEAEIERLRQFEVAFTEWLEKSDWVQEDKEGLFYGWALGLHRADAMRKLIKQQAERIAELEAECVGYANFAAYAPTAVEQIKELTDDRDTWKARAEFSFIQHDKQASALKLARSALDNSAPPYHLAWITKRDMALAAIDALGE